MRQHPEGVPLATGQIISALTNAAPAFVSRVPLGEDRGRARAAGVFVPHHAQRLLGGRHVVAHQRRRQTVQRDAARAVQHV